MNRDLADGHIVNLGGHDCPFAGVSVHMVTSDGEVTETKSNPDGTFEFSATQGETVLVYIPEDENNYMWDSEVKVLTTPSTESRRLTEKNDNENGDYESSVSIEVIEQEQNEDVKNLDRRRLGTEEIEESVPGFNFNQFNVLSYS